MSGTGEQNAVAGDTDPSRRPPVPSSGHLSARRAVRWAGYAIVVLVCTFAVAYLLLVLAADWLARHDTGNVTGPVLATARNNARGSIVALTAGLAGFGALAFTARNFILSQRTFEENAEQARRSLELSRQTFEENAEQARRAVALAEQGQVTDRYTKATDQLGAKRGSVRAGGIYALERIARDSERDRPAIMEVLTAFLHEHAEETREEAGPPPVRADIRAAAVVIGRRAFDPEETPLDIMLSVTNLAGIRIWDARFRDAALFGAILTDAKLPGADLSYANLANADLSGAHLDNADLFGASLSRADLTGANLASAKLTRADLTGARLSGAYLPGAILTGAELSGAVMNGVIASDLASPANLSGANLAGAKMAGADLSGAVLSGAEMIGADLSGATLAHADLQNAKLIGATLTGAYLDGAKLINANLRNAKLNDVYLTNVDLTNADLRGAYLDNADLFGASLSRADLTGASRAESASQIPGWVSDSAGKLQREAGQP